MHVRHDAARAADGTFWPAPVLNLARWRLLADGMVVRMLPGTRKSAA
jgi:hypothetical protein